MENYKQKPKGLITSFNLRDEEVNLYHILKMRKGAIERLNQVTDYAYNLYMSKNLNDLSLKEKNSIEMDILSEKKTILFCDMLLRAYLS